MNIPPEAIQAATEAMLNQPNADLGITLSLPGCKGMSIPDGYAHLATAALEAALPYLEVALRTQIATDIRADIAGKADYDHGLDDAARIAEEGAFHCCAHPKCPGGSICCCPDAEEGTTK